MTDTTTQGKDFWRRQLAEKIRRNPQIRLEQLKDFVPILGLKEVQNAWSKRKVRQRRS